MVNIQDELQSSIEAHGIIGDMRTAALVNDQGSVDFFCWPEFDSPAIFCSLLDTPQAGIFQLAPQIADARRDLERLQRAGWLGADDLLPEPPFDATRVDYERVIAFVWPRLERAHARFRQRATPAMRRRPPSSSATGVALR